MKRLAISPQRFLATALPLAAIFVLALTPKALPQQPAPSGLRPADSPTSSADPHLLIAAERFPEAETSLRASLAANPNSAPARYMLAYSLLRQNKPKDALAEYTRAAALQSPSAEDLKNVGQAYVLLDDFPDAANWLNRAVEMDRTNPDTWYALGRLRYSEQKYTEAADCFQKTLLLAPKSVKAENNLGLAFEGLNRPEDAIAAYRQAIAWQDADPQAKPSEQPLLNLAIALLHSGTPAEAGPLLRRAVAIAPVDPRVHEQLGHLCLQQGNFAEAATQLETATRLDPTRADLHFLLGQAYRRLGRASEAREQFDLSGQLAK